MESMGYRGRQKHMYRTPHFNHVSFSSSSRFFFFFVFITIGTFLSTIGSTITTCLDSRSILFAEADIHLQLFKQKSSAEGYKNKMVHHIRHGSLGRRFLGGLGSSPPRCTSKCGTCTPCKPVHVPVPPGTPVTAEYYPEAWRCKCGNRLYMP